MDTDIDIRSLTGADFDSAAGNHQAETNSYHQEADDYPVQQELLDVTPEPAAATPDQNPQAEHFRALREEVDRMKAERDSERKDYQNQLEMLRDNLERKHAPEERQERRFLEGLRDDEVPNVAELRQEWEQREASYVARLEELQVAQMHPDYAEVIEKFALPLVKQKPHLAEGIQGARNKALFAYELGKMAQQMQQTPSAPSAQPQVNENAQRMVENSRKPGTLSQAGGQGALSKADYFATMSDQEFMRMASRNLEGI